MNLAEKRLFLLDLDGTLYLEETLLPGAADFLCHVERRGLTARFLTNNSSRGVVAGLEKMRRLGVPAEAESFLTSVEATIHALRRRPAGEVYFVVGTQSLCAQLREAGVALREEAAEDVTAVLVGFDTEMSYRKVEIACRLLARGADYLATNPDLACPTLFGFVPDCGAICQLIGNAVGRAPVFLGKPAPEMIHMALEQTGYSKAETLMVGDRLYTDIACGVNAGVDTALVLTGEATRESAAASETKPTVIFKDMAELLTQLTAAEKEGT